MTALRIVEHDFGEKRKPRAIGGSERVVRREFGFAGDEAHLALERVVDAVDAQRGRRPDFTWARSGVGTCTRANGAVAASKTATVAPRAGFSPSGRAASRRWRRWASELPVARRWFPVRRGWRARCRQPRAPVSAVRACAFLEFARSASASRSVASAELAEATWRSASDWLTRLRAPGPTTGRARGLRRRAGRAAPSRRAAAARMLVSRGPF